MKRGARTIRTAIAPAQGGFAVTVNGRPARTPGGRPLVVPGQALAREIAGEIREEPGVLAGTAPKGADAPNLRLAAAAIDLIEGEAGARARIGADLAAYAETDLVCFLADGPDDLARRQEKALRPLRAWFEARFGAALAVTTGLRAPPQDAAALAAVRSEVEASDPFRLAALSLAARAAGSIVIALALAEGAIDPSAAWEASSTEETAQAERWGEDAEAARMRAAKALDLEHAARFLGLLAEDGVA